MSGIISTPKVDQDWWRQACVYQIYPRSFCDANGDGIGDLKGITSKVPYFKELGIDAVWLSPFYPSALKDGGYDVADYRNVDPKIGTLEDFDEMMAALKEINVKVMVDIVPNHSSDDHAWFQEALKSPKGSPARDRYIFRDGTGPDGSEPPSDWQCVFGGPAWDRVPDGQWYLHLFDSSQPDFNWDNQEVRDDFLKTLRFWADRGVSGYRIDVAHALVKDMSEPYAPHEEVLKLWQDSLKPGAPENSHPFWDRTDVQEIYKSWRKVFNEYDPPLTAVAEAWVAPDRKHLYAHPSGLGQSFSFDILLCPFNRDDFKKTIDETFYDAKRSSSSTTWVFSNHDVVRHATRYGLDNPVQIGDGHLGFAEFCRDWLKSGGKEPPCDLVRGLKRAKAATIMMLALPGSAYIYQGEELGLPEVVEIPPSERQDPTFHRTKGEEIGRDGCRVPLPWTSEGKNFGFGDGARAHLPQPEWMGDFAVDKLDKDPESILNLYRKALKLRQKLQPEEAMEWVDDGIPDSLHFKRPGGWEVIMNFGDVPVPLPEGELLVSSEDLVDGKVGRDQSAWIKTA